MTKSENSDVSYARVVKKALLEDVLLSASSFKASIEYKANPAGVQRLLNSSVKNWHYEAGLLIGEVQCNVWINRADAKETDSGAIDTAIEEPNLDKCLFSVETLYTVVFKVPGEHRQETIKAFFDRMAPFAVWPYFRTHVATLASAAQMDVPVLPIKKLFQSVETAGTYVDPGEHNDVKKLR